MAFLRTLLWIILTAFVVVFALRNWVPVTVNLFGDVQADVKLPLLLLIAFLLGFLPLYVWYQAMRWRHARALATIERAQPVTVAPVVASPVEPQSPVI